MTTTDDALPRWDVTDVHESFDARTFLDAMDRANADVARLEALFDERNIRATDPRPVTPEDGADADAVVTAFNEYLTHADITEAYIASFTTTDTFSVPIIASAASQIIVGTTASGASKRPPGCTFWRKLLKRLLSQLTSGWAGMAPSLVMLVM